MGGLERARLAAVAAESKKAHDVIILDVAGLTALADFFVICSGHSTLQVRAITEAVQEGLTLAGETARHVEGYDRGRWVVLDYGDVVVHVFLDEDRQYYNMERLWGEARRVDLLEGAPLTRQKE